MEKRSRSAKTSTSIPRRILVPVDFSTLENPTLETAVSFARRLGSELVILHVLETPRASYAEDATLLELRRAARSGLEGIDDKVRRLARSAAPALRYRIISREGAPTTEILRVARNEKADMIVMGTHGRKGLNRLLLGSTAEHVLREAQCPVLIVKGKRAGASGSASSRSKAKAPRW